MPLLIKLGGKTVKTFEGNMADIPTLKGASEVRVKDPLSEVTRKERKALLAVSLLGTPTGIVGESRITESPDSLSAAGTVGEYLPAAVVVAMVLFVMKELMEWFRKRAERFRKTRAIKVLLAEEIERNHWALVSMFGVLGALDKWPRAVFSLRAARNGSEHLRMQMEPGNEYGGGLPIPRFYTAMYERLLPTLAELDKALFEIVRATYEKIAVLSYHREILTGFLAGEDLAPQDPDITKQFLKHFANDKDVYYAILNKGYKSLTGKELKAWRTL